MNNYRSLNHTKWECQYHVVFIPKYRRKTLYGGLRHYLGDVLRRLAEHLRVHMIPPKYSVAQVDIKGKSAIHIVGSLRADHVHMLVSIRLRRNAIHIGCAGDRVYQGEECDPHRSAGPGTSWGNTSGHGATTSRRSGRMNESCGNTSSSRNAKTGGWSNYGWRSNHL